MIFQSAVITLWREHVNAVEKYLKIKQGIIAVQNVSMTCLMENAHAHQNRMRRESIISLKSNQFHSISTRS